MEITSTAFKDGEKIPIQYVMPGAGAKNISIPLIWKNIPPGTKSFALSMVDPHPVAQNCVHWLVINLPANVTSIEEGASRKKMPPGSVELKNSFGDIGYGGSQPPKGTGDHPYVFTLYALKVEKLDLGAGTSASTFKKAPEGKTLGSATITGKYGVEPLSVPSSIVEQICVIGFHSALAEYSQEKRGSTPNVFSP